MKRANLTFLLIALGGYVASYVAVRMSSGKFPYGNAEFVILGISDGEIMTALASPESEKAKSLHKRLDFLLLIFRPMVWLDENLTGADFHKPFKIYPDGP